MTTLQKHTASVTISRATLLPLELREEAKGFIARNTIVRDKYCPHCLKAYLMTKSHELQLPTNVREHLQQQVAGDMGHEGYYLDGETLREITP